MTHQKGKKVMENILCFIGDNFIGSIFRVLYEKTDSTDDDQKSFILKIASQNEIRRAELGLYDFFSREIYMYTKVRIENIFT